MADSPKKSKLPDLNEVTNIAGKLFGDLKKSLCEIVDDYKAKRSEDKADSSAKTKTAKPKAKKSPQKPAEKKDKSE